MFISEGCSSILTTSILTRIHFNKQFSSCSALDQCWSTINKLPSQNKNTFCSLLLCLTCENIQLSQFFYCACKVRRKYCWTLNFVPQINLATRLAVNRHENDEGKCHFSFIFTMQMKCVYSDHDRWHLVRRSVAWRDVTVNLIFIAFHCISSVVTCYSIFLQLIFTILLAAVLSQGIADAQSLSEAEMIAALEEYDRAASLLCNKNSHANWAVQTDVLNETLVVEQVR